MNVISVNQLPTRIIHIDNVEYLFFSGTNYLGMGCQEPFRSNLIEEFSRYGTIYSSSRNNNLKLSIYEEAETFFAKKYGFEDAIVTTSGLVAGQLAMQTLKGKKIAYAPSAHPAIKSQDERTLYKYFNATFKEFTEEIVQITEMIDFPIVIATNTIDNIRCENYDFKWIQNLPTHKEITLLFDYSHGIGVLDLDENIWSVKNSREVIVIASLAKAVGLPGGLILGSKKTISAIRNNPVFIGSSPMAPA